jgi:hypothetical protein
VRVGSCFGVGIPDEDSLLKPRTLTIALSKPTVKTVH